MRLVLPLFAMLLLAGLLAPAMALAGQSGLAAERPCPTQQVLKQCVADETRNGFAPRASFGGEQPCGAKAIPAQAALRLGTRAAEPVAFHAPSPSWSSWVPRTLVPPPRSGTA